MTTRLRRSLAAIGLVCASWIATGQTQADWRKPPAPQQRLPDSLDCWEPALAVGPQRTVYVVAGHRTVAPGAQSYDQRLVVWRSEDAGKTFGPPSPVTSEGRLHYDQRIAVDAAGTIYISYMDRDVTGRRDLNRLRLARSRDAGRTFTVETVTTQRVNDKPELAVSRDGKHIAMVYESNPGPALISTVDAATWSAPRTVVVGAGRHFWPQTLAMGPKGDLWLAVPSMSRDDIAAERQTPVQLHVFWSGDEGEHWRDADLGTSPRFIKGCAHDPECSVKVPEIALAVDGRGRAYVAYTEGPGPHESYGLFLRSTANGGRSWSTSQVISAASRAVSNDKADHDFPAIAATAKGELCVVWVDDRRGALNVWARCSGDGGLRWGRDVLLSDAEDGAPYKSASGFRTFYGHYGGAAIDVAGRLHAVWAEGERQYRTGAVWINSVDLSDAVLR